MRSSPRTLRALTQPCHHGFRRRPPHLWGSCRSPPAATDHLLARRPWRARLPVTRDHAQRARARPRGSSASKPRSPCKAVLLSPDGFPRREQPCSPGRSAPPEPSPPVPRTLSDPPRPRSAAHRSALARRSDAAAGILRPLRRVSPDSSRLKRPAGLVGGFRSCVDRSAPPFGGDPSPATLDPREGDLAHVLALGAS